MGLRPYQCQQRIQEAGIRIQRDIIGLLDMRFDYSEFSSVIIPMDSSAGGERMPTPDAGNTGQPRHQPRWPFIYTCILITAGIIAIPVLLTGFMWFVFQASHWGQQPQDTAIYKNGVLKIRASAVSEGAYSAFIISPRPMQHPGPLHRAGLVFNNGILDYEGQQFQVLCRDEIQFKQFGGLEVGIRIESKWPVAAQLNDQSKKLIESNKAALVVLTGSRAFYFLITN